VVAHSRIALRVAPETKERWQAEAQASGLTLTAFIVSKIEGQRLSPELETFLAQRVDDVLREQISTVVAHELQGIVEGLVDEKLASPSDGWPVPADLENLAAVLLPKDFDPACFDAELHHRGTTCAACGGNGLRESPPL
jgi:hypothetical protein